jgi:hypothetical protein
VITAFLTGCAASGKDRVASEAPRPSIQFHITPLVVSAADTVRNDSVWSQNDYVDSITILITGADGMVVPHVGIQLLLEPRVEGDGPVGAAAQVTVSWRTFTDVNVDSLPKVFHSRLLLAVQPSELWRGSDGRAKNLFPSKVRVQMRLKSGIIVSRSLDLLWD